MGGTAGGDIVLGRASCCGIVSTLALAELGLGEIISALFVTLLPRECRLFIAAIEGIALVAAPAPLSVEGVGGRKGYGESISSPKTQINTSLRKHILWMANLVEVVAQKPFWVILHCLAITDCLQYGLQQTL